MAEPNREYAPFLGIKSTPQGYDCSHYGAPVYHCVFPVPESISADELADEVLQYQQDLYPAAPAMCLSFARRGVVWPDKYKTRTDLVEAIEFIQLLPSMEGDLNLTHWGGRIRSFMGQSAMRPFIMSERMVIYDIDTGLSGRQIADEARLHFKHIKKRNKIDKMILRFPNGGSVLVHQYLKKGLGLGHLTTAIQRARKMELSTNTSVIAA